MAGTSTNITEREPEVTWPEMEPETEPEPEIHPEPEVEPEVEFEPEIIPEFLLPNETGVQYAEIEQESEVEIEPEGPPIEGIPSAEGGSIDGLRPWYLRPDPDFRKLDQHLGVFWPLHVYFIGACFVLLVLVALVHIIQICRLKRSLGKPYYITLHFLLVICGSSRAVHFFVDPYHSTDYLPLVWSFITLHMYDPCMLSSFILVFITLFKVTRMRVISHGLFNPILISSIIVISFLVTLSGDIIFGLIKGTGLYMFLCQLYFVIMGMLSSGLYGYLFCRIFNRLFMTRVKINRMSRGVSLHKKKRRKSAELKDKDIPCVYTMDNLKQPEQKFPLLEDKNDRNDKEPNEISKNKVEIICDISSTGMDDKPENVQLPSKVNKVVLRETSVKHTPSIKKRLFDFKDPDDIVEARIPLVAKLVLIAALLFLLISLCNLISMVLSAGGVGETERGFADAWYWWTYQTVTRLLEVGMAAVVAVIGAAPLYTKTKLPSDK